MVQDIRTLKVKIYPPCIGSSQALKYSPKFSSELLGRRGELVRARAPAADAACPGGRVSGSRGVANTLRAGTDGVLGLVSPVTVSESSRFAHARRMQKCRKWDRKRRQPSDGP